VRAEDDPLTYAYLKSTRSPHRRQDERKHIIQRCRSHRANAATGDRYASTDGQSGCARIRLLCNECESPLLDNVASHFGLGASALVGGEEEHERETAKLYIKIGQLTVEPKSRSWKQVGYGYRYVASWKFRKIANCEAVQFW
jgi:hypothetical protein